MPTLPVGGTSDIGFDYHAPNFIEAVTSCLRPDTCLRLSGDATVAFLCAHAMGISQPLRLAVHTGREESQAIMHVETVARLLELTRPNTAMNIAFPSGYQQGFDVGCLGRFRNVQYISVSQELGIEIVQHLGRRRTNASGEEEWPCPRLWGLDLSNLKGVASITDIRKWVSGRWEKVRAPAETTAEDSVEVSTPNGRAGSSETWRPVKKTRRRQ